MRRMYDAVTPQGFTNNEFQIAAGYCGGDTPHVWTKSEWDSTAQRYRLPIWVRSNPAGHDGAAEARLFKSVLDSIGCPNLVTVALDYETAVDNQYLIAFENEMHLLGGHDVMLYGSLSYVEQNLNPSGGYWVAEWDDLANLPAGTVAHQYMNHPNYDESVVSDSVILWDTALAPVPSFSGDDMYAYFNVDNPGVDYFLPVEPAGTLSAPQGGAKNGPMWVNFAAQASGVVTVDMLQKGAWVATSIRNLTVAPGGHFFFALPSDGSVEILRVRTTTKLIGYVVGRQV